MRVLIHRVMPGIEGEHANRIALRFGDLVRTNHTRRVACPRRRYRAVVGILRRRAKGYDRSAAREHGKL